MSTRTAPTLLALACAVGLLTSVPTGAAVGAAAAGGVRCDGHRPTLVTSAADVTGTPGDDVIVVLGARAEVEAGAGDDRVCVRGRGGWKSVTGGPGDDRILVESRTRVVADLRAGTDTFRGGPRADLVISGWPGARNADRLLLGRGDDTLVLVEGADHRRAVLRGGRGTDLLRVTRRSGSLRLDAGTASASLDGEAHARWDSFESYALSSGTHQAFVGSPGDDAVSFDGRGAVEAITGDGDDVVGLRVDPGPTALVPGSRPGGDRHRRAGVVIDTGTGRDRLELGTSASLVRGDLVTDRIEFSEEGALVGVLAATGVEDLTVSAPVDAGAEVRSRVELVGDDATNELKASACHVVLLGAGGDDELGVGLDPQGGFFVSAGGIDRGCRRTSEVYGGPGDDAMTSRVTTFDTRGLEVGDTVEEVELPVKDLLDGGDGNDSARAGAGRDTCIAETRVACEA